MKRGRTRTRTRPESIRDQHESSFTPLLRRLWQSSRAILSVSFVDTEGESIDYCASVDPYEAKIVGAHMLVVTDIIARRLAQLAEHGQPYEIELLGATRDLVVRRVSDEYALVVATTPGGIDRTVHAAIEKCVDGLRREGEIDVPSWEPRPKALEVYVRKAVGWKYAPALFSVGGKWTEVADVLGRWVDEQETGLVCFRVRTRDGDELTLAHDAELDRWTLLTDTWA